MSAKNNFTKRFGITPRIILVGATIERLPREEARLRNDKIFNAFCEVATGVLGRHPLDKEIFGEVKL